MNDDGLLYDDIDKNTSTKSKSVIVIKLDFLENLMLNYLHIKKELKAEDRINEISFISENVGINKDDVTNDIDFYKESLNVR